MRYDLSEFSDETRRTPEQIEKSRRISQEHAANEARARKEGCFIHSDPLALGGGLIYGPDGQIGAVSLGGSKPEDRARRDAALKLLIECANIGLSGKVRL